MVYLANNPYRSSDIYHHGIKGQRWGVRRFQNLDGSLTKAGRERYGSDISSIGSENARKQFERYQRLSGTKSILGGDHRNDEGTKVYKEYTKEAEKNSKNLRNAAYKEGKDSYREKSRAVASKFFDRYSEAVLKDIGYDPSKKNKEWIQNQWWFGMPLYEVI